MTSYQEDWERDGARAATRAFWPDRFVNEHLSPLFFRRTEGDLTGGIREVVSEEQFWTEDASVVFGAVRMDGFRLSDWFPRAPGVFWSRHALDARQGAWSVSPQSDPELGTYYSPESKMDLIEEGGIGTIRLRPRKIDDEQCWLATALTGNECHGGIPLAIPDTMLRNGRVNWGDRVSMRGRVRFLQDAGLDDTAAYVHHARPLIVFVDELRGVATERWDSRIIITPVVLFESVEETAEGQHARPAYTFVHCAAGSDAELDSAAGWIEKYASKYAGRVITNFDEQRPLLADAPLSYQRLVARKYDRVIIERFGGTLVANRIDQLVQDSLITQNFGDVHMGHRIQVGGSAIINIDSAMSNVVQTINTGPGLDATQKSELEGLVRSLQGDLEKLKTTHAEETKAIADALEKAVANAAKPSEQRKKNLLQLSATGLREAAELVKDTAPGILTTAALIAKFIAGLG